MILVDTTSMLDIWRYLNHIELALGKIGITVVTNIGMTDYTI